MIDLSVLVFDFGLSHIGVAVAENSRNFAFALRTLPAKAGRVENNIISSLFEEWQPEKAIVGYPLNMDGTDTTLGTAVKKFAYFLKMEFGIDTEFVDERLSTFEANQRHSKMQYDHAVAAQVIAETWLQGRSKEP